MEEGEEGHKASVLERNLGGYCQGVGGRIDSPGGTETPGVEGHPRGDETSIVTSKGNGVTGGGQVGVGRRRKISSHPGDQGCRDSARTKHGHRRSRAISAAAPIVGQDRERERKRRQGRGTGCKHMNGGHRWHRCFQSQSWHKPRVHHTGVGGVDGGSSRCGSPREQGRPQGDRYI